LTRKHAPHQWAIIQTELGTALQELGKGESGMAHLEEAVAAYREALQEIDRAHVPLKWAGIQNILGRALEKLGARETGTARLEEAVEAYREALQEFNEERAPYYRQDAQESLERVQALLSRKAQADTSSGK
jgi:tetratricopeptide (TPR) repeat protein